MKSLSLTFSVSCFLLVGTAFAHSAHAGQSELSYDLVDTTTPMTDYQIQSLCDQKTNDVQTSLSAVSTHLTGSPDSLQVIGYYGQQPSSTGPQTEPATESYCYVTFKSNVSNVTFTSYSAGHFTGLNNSTWGTACKPTYDKIAADPMTIIDDYIESASLFQGMICDVETVQAVVAQ